ncbi:MAG TPA: hypothetical protein VKI41_06060 [Vicinamibacteria bacterium]|nr:hypothetical protein [Vicinamibacteria bacterium]
MHLDIADAIVFASEDWLQLANGMDGRPAEPAGVLGRPFFDFAPDSHIFPLYELVFRRVRRTGQPIRIPFTSESSSERRQMEMEVLPLEGGGLECRYHTVLVEALGPGASPGDAPRPPLLTLCSWCKKVKLPEGPWVEVEAAAQRLEFFLGEAPQLTHGICLPCKDALWAGLAVAKQS